MIYFTFQELFRAFVVSFSRLRSSSIADSISSSQVVHGRAFRYIRVSNSLTNLSLIRVAHIGPNRNLQEQLSFPVSLSQLSSVIRFLIVMTSHFVTAHRPASSWRVVQQRRQLLLNPLLCSSPFLCFRDVHLHLLDPFGKATVTSLDSLAFHSHFHSRNLISQTSPKSAKLSSRNFHRSVRRYSIVVSMARLISNFSVRNLEYQP